MFRLLAVPALLLLLAGGLPAQQQTGSDKPEKNLPDGMKALKDPDARVRYSSLELLIKVGASAKFAVPTLHEMLQMDKSLAVKMKVAEALWVIEQTPPRTLLPVLLLGLQQKQSNLRLQAVQVIGKIGAPAKNAIPELRATLKDPDDNVKMQAALALGAMGKTAKKAVPDLLAILPDDDLGLLQATVGLAVSKIGPDAVPELIAAQKEKKVEIRRGAMYALMLLGQQAKEAAPVAAAALKDGDPLVGSFAIRLLGTLGPEAREQAPALREALKSKDQLLRAEAAVALWQVSNDVLGVPVLVALLKEKDEEVRARGATGLGQIGQLKDGVGPALLQGLSDKSIRVRLASVEALGRIGPAAKAHTAELGKLLLDKEAEVQVEAAFALWRIEAATERVLPVLTKALNDEAVEVRLRALAALGEIGPPAASARARVFELAREATDTQVRTAARAALAKMTPKKQPTQP